MIVGAPQEPARGREIGGTPTPHRCTPAWFRSISRRHTNAPARANEGKHRRPHISEKGVGGSEELLVSKLVFCIFLFYPLNMSFTEILHEIESLPSKQRWELLGRLHQLTEEDVPESLRQGMAEAQRGELYDLDQILSNPPTGL